ncbi:hypothetical protein J9231_02195 [Providencia rettgeri]|uniref:hypothetical protein n=1 Tax=Providencia TaxID=586 RepID=UPI001B3897E3|nr:hypothetical protein [Providencia rettgeri]MBQ0326664.1 hypothetical protein [Providencia rettgeri]
MEYIYRIDTESNFSLIKDNSFRAKRWFLNEDFPHKLLKDEFSKMSPNQGIYRICFFTSEAHAKSSLNYEFTSLHGGKVFLRCPKFAVTNAGFKESWDDGFHTGDAYLFWTRELIEKENDRFSLACIPLSVFQVFDNGEWVDYEKYNKKKSKERSETLQPQSQNAFNHYADKKTSWWDSLLFWKK